MHFVPRVCRVQTSAEMSVVSLYAETCVSVRKMKKDVELRKTYRCTPPCL